MAAALKANPKVAWVFEHKCPEMAGKVRELTAQAPKDLTPEQIRAAEVAVLGAFEDFVIYTTPEVMAEKSEKFVSQTIEKLLDGIIPDSYTKEYTLILLATPIKDVENRKLRLAELYSGLAPYASWQTNYTFTESDTMTSNATFGINAGVSAGVQSGRNASVANSSGETDSTQQTKTDSQNETHTDQEMKTETDSFQKNDRFIDTLKPITSRDGLFFMV